MLSFEDALTRVLDGVQPLATESVSLAEASGRVLAGDLLTSRPLPAFDYSERDGYALDPSSISGAPPFRIAVAGEQRAGGGLSELRPGMAARIFTGAALPVGASAVVMQEDVSREGDHIRLGSLPSAGQFVRHRGDDLPGGAPALKRGTRLSPGAIALAGMLGAPEVPVARRPRVNILPNGDELRPSGSALRHGEIHESNAEALAALARQAGAVTAVLPIVPDEAAAVRSAIESGLSGSDLLVTVGGVSVGEHDLVRSSLEAAKVKLDFWRIALKPGKPLAFGRHGNVRVLALPGNPASALVTFGLFGMPLLRALQGDARTRPFAIVARLAKSLPLNAEREQIIQVSLEQVADALQATPLRQQASGAAISLAASDGLARLPRGEGMVDPGVSVPVIRWSDM
jgi:molybdopterin molybdotransferase